MAIQAKKKFLQTEPNIDTHSLSFSEKTWQVIARLAEANTDGNKSKLLTMLAHHADMVPDAFGIRTAPLDDDTEACDPAATA